MTQSVKVAIRHAEPEDVGAIERIQEESPGAARWQPHSYLEHDCVVAVATGNIVGFIVIRRTAPAETEILNLAVAPSWRRRGIASSLLGEALRGVSGDVFLEVRESNIAARQLYAGAGFREAGIRRDYYSDPPEAAIVMRLRS